MTDQTIVGKPDLFDPGFYLDHPERTYRWLRNAEPVYWNEHAHGGFWVLSKHADVCDVGRNPQTYSAASGLMVQSPETELINTMMAGSLAASDPPLHRDLRKAVVDVFRPPAVANLELLIRERVSVLLDRISPDEPFDLVSTVSGPLPTWVVGELMGTPEDERHRLEELIDATLAYSDPEADFDAIGAQAMGSVFEFFGSLVSSRRACPGEDLVSSICQGQIGDRPLDDGEAVQYTYVVLGAGSETVRTAISNSVLLLLRHPDQATALRSDQSLLGGAIEEMLRFTPPINYFCRNARTDHELRGKRIRAGDQLMLHYAAANRDEEVFGNNADDFDISRAPNPHVAFGFGEHFCLGAGLGRLQLRIFFEDFLTRFSSVELIGEPLRFRNTNVNGIKQLLLKVS